MEKFQSRVIYKGLSQFTGNSTTKSIVTLVARLRFCFPQTKKKKGEGRGGERKGKTKKKKKERKKREIYLPFTVPPFIHLVRRAFKNSRGDKSQLTKFIVHSSGGFNWWHNFIWNLRIVEKPAGQKYDVSSRSFQQRSMPDNAWYMMHRAGKGVHFSHRPMISSRSIHTSLFLVCPRYIVPKPYFSKIIHDTPNARTRMGAYWLCESDGVLVGCKNPIIIELLVQKRIREKEKKKRKGKIKGLYVCNFKQFNSIEFARILSFLGWCLKVVLEWQF